MHVKGRPTAGTKLGHIYSIVLLHPYLGRNIWTKYFWYLQNLFEKGMYNGIQTFSLKFGYSEKATKFEKIFHLKFDATQ